ncbi:hypothetical protein GCM10017673_38940 [Streptosporangium violaceochromogenes]|nr:hypothetical protein GCM10017673_38940 [Streptosporangium violaceochromogenes]
MGPATDVLSGLWWYACVALACLTVWGLALATVPHLTRHLFAPGARLLGLGPRSLLVLAALGGSVLWPVAAVLLGADLVRRVGRRPL